MLGSGALFTLLLAAPVAPVAGSESGSGSCPRDYSVAPVEGAAPRIDGVLDAGEWPSDGWESDLVFPWRRELAPATAFVARVDVSGLHFAFRVTDADVVIVEGAPGDESLVARGDRVELFLARDPALEEYYSIEIDPTGRVLDYQGRHYREFDPAWDLVGLEAAGKVRPGGYDVEGFIPLRALEEMGLPWGPASTVLAGVFRGEFGHGDGDRIKESWISWVRPEVPEPDFHVPSAFGCFRLPPAPWSGPHRPNMVGAYGPWLADEVLGSDPPDLSFRSGRWASVDEWRRVARARTLERIAPVDLGGVPEVTVVSRHTHDGLDFERLTWQLPAGPPTEAVFIKPSGAEGPLPGILGLHDHGGNKFLGWRKIVLTGTDDWEIQRVHQAESYEGIPWANALARRGYAVLVHDTFPFASRRVRVRDVPPLIRRGGVDPAPDDPEGVERYNDFAGAHEHVMAKSLFSAGTTWPGVYLVEDQRALDVLAARPEVDASRLGCAGLSGGGMRTVFLGGVDERVKVAVAVGFMTTWRDFLLDKVYTHTWMTYVPLLPRELDFPEILALRAPAATMVQSCRQDPLYTLPEMERADAMLRETFERAGAADRYRGLFYEGGHKFDREMQGDAFAWFDRFLKE